MEREIKGQDEWIRQPAPIKISIDISGNDTVVVVPYDFRNGDRQSFADDISFCPTPDGRFAPVVAQLIVDERIVGKIGYQPLQVEAVRRLDEGDN
jgi:hypothetical protein